MQIIYIYIFIYLLHIIYYMCKNVLFAEISVEGMMNKNNPTSVGAVGVYTHRRTSTHM